MARAARGKWFTVVEHQFVQLVALPPSKSSMANTVNAAQFKRSPVEE